MLSLHYFLLFFIIESQTRKRTASDAAFENVKPQKAAEIELALRETNNEYTECIMNLQGNMVKLQKELSLLIIENHKFRDIIRIYAETGANTIVRSLVELFLKTYENNLWNSAFILYFHITRRNDYHILDLNVSDTELELMTYRNVNDGQQETIHQEYRKNVQDFLFLRKIKGIKGLNRKQLLMNRIADSIVSVTPIKNLTIVNIDEVKNALRNIYSSFSDVRYTGFTGTKTFHLPRVIPPITIAQVYAYSYILIELGFEPEYQFGPD